MKNSSIDVIVLVNAKTFIYNLSQEEKLMAFAMIKKLSELPHPPQLVKLIDKDNRIYEARGATKDFWIRLFWFYSKPEGEDSKIVITNGYLKKENKTDPDEIKKAKKLKRKYEA